MKLYTRSELETKSRNELWAILDSLSLSHRRSKADCIEAILSVMPQLEAQAEFEVYVQTQVDDFEYRAELNKRGYRDCMEGLPEQVDHISYRAGYARAWRDQIVLPEEREQQGATIEKSEQPQISDDDILTPYTLAEWEAIPKIPGTRYFGNCEWRDSRNARTNCYAKHYTKRQLAIMDGKVPKAASKLIREWVRF